MFYCTCKMKYLYLEYCIFQLCVTINNIEQVRKSLSPMPEMLQFNEIQTALDCHSVKNRSKYDLSKILAKADAQMVQKIKNVVDRVADKVSFCCLMN